MNPARSSSITLAIGVLATFLVAMSPTATWAAEPGKQETKAKNQSQSQTVPHAKKSTTPKFASVETAGKAQSCYGEAPRLDKLTPDEGKAGLPAPYGEVKEVDVLADGTRRI